MGWARPREHPGVSSTLDTQPWHGTDAPWPQGPRPSTPAWASECDLGGGAGAGPPRTPCLAPPTPLHAHVASPARGRACRTRVTAIHTRAADGTLTTEPTTATPPWSVGPSSRGGLNTDQPRGCTGLRWEARSRPAGRGHAAHSLVALGPPGTGDGPFCGREVAPVYTFAVIGTSGSSASSAVAAGHPCSRWSVGPQGLLPFRSGPIFVTIWPGRGEGALKMGRTLKLRVRT